MKTKLPDGQYCMTLEHPPNQRKGTYITTVTTGEHKGKSIRFMMYTHPAEVDNG